MRRFSIFFMLFCFTVTLSSNSMFMLSIERGRVYTESFSITHMLKTAISSPAQKSHEKKAEFSPRCFLCHNHVKLTSYTIPEKKVTSLGAEINYTDVDFLRAYPALDHSLVKDPAKNYLDHGIRSKLSIPLLLQSSVLLI